jgi:chemotaxis signal transduction protein
VTTIVRVRTQDGDYALPVDSVREVRSVAGLSPLPEARDGVAGLLHLGGRTITVLSLLAREGAHVVVLEVDDLVFGLLVEQVSGVAQVADDAIGPSPVGQDRPMVDAVLSMPDGVVLRLDVAALARWLAT